jgi:hypothetical protein
MVENNLTVWLGTLGLESFVCGTVSIDSCNSTPKAQTEPPSLSRQVKQQKPLPQYEVVDERPGLVLLALKS